MENVTSFAMTNRTEEDSVDDNGAVTPHQRPVATIALYVTIVVLQLLIMVGMGAVTTVREIWQHLKNPICVLIALACQFILLPLCAFGLINLLQLSTLDSLTVLILSCCPGGTVSNLYTYLCDGDVSLSIVLTTVSTTLAIGMTPLNLWIYSRHWEMGNIKVPYSRIAITLAFILFPMMAGMLIKVYRPKIASIVAKVASSVGLVLTWVSILLQYLSDPDVYPQPWQLWIVSVAIPCVGFIVGYIAALIFRQNHRLSRTIAMETGIQSVSLSSGIIITSFPSELHPYLLPFPYMNGLCVTGGGMLLAAVIRIKSCMTNVNKDSEQNIERVKEEL